MTDVSRTFVCRHCDKRFERGRRQNQHHRANAGFHHAGRYCSNRCRVAAHRTRSRAPQALQGTYTHASGTGPMQRVDTKREFSTKKTTDGPIFQRHTPPLNVLGGYCFPGAPEVDV